MTPLGRRLLDRITWPIYWTPFDHNSYELARYREFLAKNLVGYHTRDMFYKFEFEMNSSCNRKCPYCPNHEYSRGTRKMSLELIERLVGELAAINYRGIISPHFYGEPLLDARLGEILSLFRSRVPEARVTLYTNGDLLTQDRYRSLSEAGISTFFVTSHEGREPEAFLKWYRPGHDDIVFEKMDSTLRLSNRSGLAHVDRYKVSAKCLMSTNNLVVDVDGNVLYCVNDYFSSHAMGNVNNQGLMSIWDGTRYKELRKKSRAGVKELDICQRCNPA